MQRIPVKNVSAQQIDVDNAKHQQIGVGNSYIIAGEPYEGPYEVTPSARNEIVLETKTKRMADDVTVRKIPYEEVSNPQGGKTATIGGY